MGIHISIPQALLAIHRRYDAEFWLNHDTDKCRKCRKALSK